MNPESLNRIGIVAKSFEASKGGLEQYFNRLSRQLVGRGYSLSLFGEGFSTWLKNHQKIRCRPVSVLKLTQAVRKLTFNLNAKKTIQSESKNLDLVLTAGKTDFGDIYRAGGGVHKHFVRECLSPLQNWNPKHIVENWLEKKLLTEDPPKSVIANSKMVKEQLENYYDYPADRITVIYNGINMDKFSLENREDTRKKVRKNHNVDSDATVGLFVGNDPERKGLYKLFESLQNLDSNSLEVLIVGSLDESTIVSKAKDYNVEEAVHPVGFTSKVSDYYQASDILVLPSKYDPGANVVQEALASGCPIITSRTNGTHELLQPGETGYVLSNPEDTEELAELLRTFLSNQSSFSPKTCRDSVKGLSLDKHTDKVLDVLQGFVQKR